MGRELGDGCVLQQRQGTLQRHQVSSHRSVRRRGAGDAGGDGEAGVAGGHLPAQRDAPTPHGHAAGRDETPFNAGLL